MNHPYVYGGNDYGTIRITLSNQMKNIVTKPVDKKIKFYWLNWMTYFLNFFIKDQKFYPQKATY